MDSLLPRAHHPSPSHCCCHWMSTSWSLGRAARGQSGASVQSHRATGWGVSGGEGQSAQAQQVGFPQQEPKSQCPDLVGAQSSQTPAVSCPRKALDLGPRQAGSEWELTKGQDVVWVLRLEARVALTETGV